MVQDLNTQELMIGSLRRNWSCSINISGNAGDSMQTIKDALDYYDEKSAKRCEHLVFFGGA